MSNKHAGERLFRFNPFNIKNWTDEEVIEQFGLLEESLPDGDTPQELATSIDVYANMGYLIGEMYARYHESVSIADNELKIGIANAIYRERNNWKDFSKEKPPAMSYFEAKAESQYREEYRELARKESMFKRLKFAYESIQDKQNALKKRLDAIKYDVFNQ